MVRRLVTEAQGTAWGTPSRMVGPRGCRMVQAEKVCGAGGRAGRRPGGHVRGGASSPRDPPLVSRPPGHPRQRARRDACRVTVGGKINRGSSAERGHAFFTFMLTFRLGHITISWWGTGINNTNNQLDVIDGKVDNANKQQSEHVFLWLNMTISWWGIETNNTNY